MKCQHCKKEFEEREIEVHHLHPKFMDNKKGNGMKINLCKKCHNVLHLIIPKIIWDALGEDRKMGIGLRVISFSKKYGGLI